MIHVVIDTREQTPFTFDRFPDVHPVVGTLSSGDYSLKGFEDIFAIERKSINDFVGTLTTGHDRFKRELARLRCYDAAAIVVEAPYSIIRCARYRSTIPPEQIEQMMLSIIVNYRMPIYFADDHFHAEGIVYNLIRHYYRHARARYKAVEALID